LSPVNGHGGTILRHCKPKPAVIAS